MLMTSGPSSAKPRAKAAFRVSVKTPFAASSCRRGTTSGIIAASAGAKNTVTVDTNKFSRSSSRRKSPTRNRPIIARPRRTLVAMSTSTVDTVHVDLGHRRHEHGRRQERQDQQADRGIRVVLGDDDRQPEQHHVPADLGRCLRQPQSKERGIAEDRERAFGADFPCGLVDRFDVDRHPRVGHEGRSGGVGRRGGASPTTAAVIAGSPRSTNAASRRSSVARAISVAVARPAARTPMSAPSRSTSQVSPPHGAPDEGGPRPRAAGPRWVGPARRAGYQRRGRPRLGTRSRSVAGTPMRSMGVTSTVTSGCVADSWAMIPPGRVKDPVSLSGAPIALSVKGSRARQRRP